MLLIILSRWLRLLLVRFENGFLGDADEDLAILYLAVLTLERQPIGYAARLTVRSVEHEVCAANATVADQVVAAPDGELEHVSRGSLQVKDEAFGPLGLHTWHVLSFLHH